MIIQCTQCSTHYMFDESLIEGEGVWVRCSHCKNIFFQGNPVEEKVIVPADMVVERIPDETKLKFDAIEADIFDEVIGTIGDASLKKGEPEFRWEGEVEETQAPFDISGYDSFAAEREKSFGEFGGRLTEEFTEADSDDYHEESIPDEKKATPEEKETRPGRRRFFIYAAVAVVVLAGAYFWFFPTSAREIIRTASQVFTIKEVVEGEGSAHNALVGEKREIALTEMRDHSVENWIVGTVFVIEGIAVNKSDHPLSKIKVRGNLVDSSGSVVATEQAIVGNVLTEEELRNLTKEEIISELSKSWGRDFANREIPREGSIPFMIVFCNPPENAKGYVIDFEGAHDTGKR